MPAISFVLVLVPTFFVMPFVLDTKWIASKSMDDMESQDLACMHSGLYIAQDVYGGMRCLESHPSNCYVCLLLWYVHIYLFATLGTALVMAVFLALAAFSYNMEADNLYIRHVVNRGGQ